MGKELVSYTATPIEGDVARFQFDDPGSATSNSLTGLGRVQREVREGFDLRSGALEVDQRRWL